MFKAWYKTQFWLDYTSVTVRKSTNVCIIRVLFLVATALQSVVLIASYHHFSYLVLCIFGGFDI